MNRIAVACVAVLGTLAGGTQLASANVEIGGTAGVHFFADDNALGTKREDIVSHGSSSLFALRVSVGIGKMFGVEVEGGAIPTESGHDDVTFDVWMALVRANLIVNFRNEPANRFVPFVIAGAGAMRIVDIGTVDDSLLRKETDGFGQIGAGVKYRAGNGWGVRFDARLLLPPSNEDKPVTQDFELLLGLYRDLGFKAAPKKPEPKADNDPDKDGIVGATDQCPNEAEDKDDFEDDNGCPDPDNDADGLLDGGDTCPKEAEDKDSFKDEDGCPDPDNDDDGVLDAADKCIDQPETKNGFEDEDGCPDEVPAKLAKFTGSIQGINFKTADAALLPGSNKVLDKAIAVLNEFKDVKLEVGGHTDDVALKNTKKFTDNEALSQARAETVKAYFVKKGIAEDRVVAKGYGSNAPKVDPTGLKGGKLTKARAQNRRVEFTLVPAGGSAPEPKAEEPKAEEPKKEEPKAEEPKKEEPKAEDAPKADQKKPDTKKADAKKGIADPFGGDAPKTKGE